MQAWMAGVHQHRKTLRNPQSLNRPPLVVYMRDGQDAFWSNKYMLHLRYGKGFWRTWCTTQSSGILTCSLYTEQQASMVTVSLWNCAKAMWMTPKAVLGNRQRDTLSSNALLFRRSKQGGECHLYAWVRDLLSVFRASGGHTKLTVIHRSS